jgi:YYY domain-containing protein
LNRSVTAASALLFASVLLLASASGAAVLARLLRGDDGDGARAEIAFAFSLPVGLVAAALPGWLLSGFLFVPIRALALPLAFLALAALLLWGFTDLLGVLARARSLVPPAVLFLAIFALFLWIRATFGEIRQTEKPMDFAVLSGLMATARLPFPDPWLAGFRFPYYHFGTYLFALPARAALVPSEYAYNLVAALLPALAALAAYGAVRARRGGPRLALLAGAVLVLGGTFDGARQALSDKPLADLDWWVSSRRVANAITEWPLFTFRLGDLHPHAVTFPFLVAFFGLAGRIGTTAGTLADGVFLAAVLSANPWDLPACLLALGAGNLMERAFRSALLRSVFSVLFAVPFLLPFLRSPRPELHGLTFWKESTTAGEAFLHFGTLCVVPALALGVALVRSQTRTDRALVAATAFPALGIALAVLTKRPVFGLAAGCVAAVLWLLLREPSAGEGAPPSGALRAGFLFAAAGATLAAVPDVVLVSDSYGDQLRRMNTVFKTFMGAWPLLALGGALLLPLALSTRRARGLVRAALLVTAAALLVHPLSAVVFRARWPGAVDGLDGLAWMQREAPGDRAAVEWLRTHAVDGAVLAEATGNAYTDYSRIGGATGLPTVLGWDNHEGLWRGGAATPELEGRRRDLRLLYTSEDADAVFAVLHRFHVRYVFVGSLEHRDFGPNAFPLRANFRRAFEAKDAAVYEILK